MRFALVTGGAGFIGSHLVRRLLEKGVNVRILDDFSTGDTVNLRDIERDVEVVTGSIVDLDTCRVAAKSVDTVFHLAASVSVPLSISDPILSDQSNTRGVLNMLLAARDADATRFIFSSSAAVYGNTESPMQTEALQPKPTSPYGVQKLTGECYANVFAGLYGMETVSLRYFNVYGPGQNPNAEYAAVIPKFIGRLLASKAPTVYGDGEQTRDFCYVEDVAEANIMAASTYNRDAFGKTFNIAGGAATSLNQLLLSLAKVTGVTVDPIYELARVGDIKHSKADVTLAREMLGFKSRVALEPGLASTVKYYRSLW